MLDPAKVCLFIPSGLRKFKLDLFERIGRHIVAKGGIVIRHQASMLEKLSDDITPIVGCMPDCAYLIRSWQDAGRQWCYWDRGYARRVFATWLPRGEAGGFYRYHVNSFQMTHIRDVPDDRWKALKIEVKPWRKEGRRPTDPIIIADTLPDYWIMRGLVGWSERVAERLRQQTRRPVIIRHKESPLPLDQELAEAHCLVTHGSIAAVEAAIMGCPVFVDASSAAALVGQTDLDRIEEPLFPGRRAWLNSLAYCQYNEAELVDGTLWRLIT